MDTIKVVFHIMAGSGPTDSIYGKNGYIHQIYEKTANRKINFVSYCGTYLYGQKQKDFINDCSDAQIVILDAWNHPLNDNHYEPGWKKAQASIAAIANEIISAYPKVHVFAQLMEGIRKVKVHDYAIPIADWLDDRIVNALQQGLANKDLPNVLVFDDSQKHIDAALRQLSNSYNLTIAKSYNHTEKLLAKEKFDFVLLDLLVPPSIEGLNPAAKIFAGQEMPLTPLLAFYALSKDIKKIAITTDANHHNHPASAAIDIFTGLIVLNDIKIIITNRAMNYDGEKDWQKLINLLQ